MVSGNVSQCEQAYVGSHKYVEIMILYLQQT